MCILLSPRRAEVGTLDSWLTYKILKHKYAPNMNTFINFADTYRVVNILLNVKDFGEIFSSRFRDKSLRLK